MTFKEEIQQIVPILKAGGSIIFPTDTIWGIGCDALNEAAVKRIFDIKKRAYDKPMPLLVEDYQRLQQYVERIPPKAASLVDYFDRPLTIVYHNARNLPPNLIATDGSIAIRVTKDPFCQALIEALGSPIIATSANYSGVPSPSNFSEIDPAFLQEADYVAQHRQGEAALNKASMVVRIEANGELVVLRK